MILSWLEKVTSHMGTETRPQLNLRQQWRILDNERKLDPVILRE